VKLLNADVDGRNIVPVIRSATAPSPHTVVHWGGGKRSQWAVREGDWKLIGNLQSAAGDVLSAEDKRLFLANLATDRGEKSNLARQHPEIVKRLSKLRADWLAGQKETELESTPSQDAKGNER
jgi:arylsulfatase A